MTIIFMYSKNNKTSVSFRLLLNLTNKMDLRRDDKHQHYQTLVYTTHGRIQKIMLKKINSKHQETTCDEEFELPDASYYLSDMYILKKHGTLTYKPPVQMYDN